MRAFLLLMLTLCAGGALAQGEWPDWRGPTHEGHTAATGLPLHWSETENVAWKTAIHDHGHSTPVVWGGQIWLTTAKEDGTAFYAICADATSGEIVHDIEVFQATEPQRINPMNTYATPSAAIEAGRVYVHYGSLGTACIDTASGEVLWRRDDLNCNHLQGPASSPFIFENLLIVHLEGIDAQFIVALDKQSGETVWQYDRPRDLYTPDIRPVFLKSYQTPIVVDVAGTPQLISNGALMATGHNPHTGEELWRILYRDDSTVSRIIHGHGLLFINTGGPPGGGELWAVREGGKGDITETHVAWKMIDDTPYESSPIMVDDLLYSLSDRGALSCLETATGEVVWATELEGRFGASALAAPGRIYLSNKKGATTIFAPGREYRELAVNQLDGELWASPAVTGNALLLRTTTHLYRIEE